MAAFARAREVVVEFMADAVVGQVVLLGIDATTSSSTALPSEGLESFLRPVHDHARLTNRAELYLAAGLPMEQVLTALRVSRATWYRRVEALRVHKIARSNAWDTRKGTHDTYSAVAFDEPEADDSPWIYILQGEPGTTEQHDWDPHEVDAPGRTAADKALEQLCWKRKIRWTRSSRLGGRAGWFATEERTEADDDA